jgi:hypothetical protein
VRPVRKKEKLSWLILSFLISVIGIVVHDCLIFELIFVQKIRNTGKLRKKPAESLQNALKYCIIIECVMYSRQTRQRVPAICECSENPAQESILHKRF